MPTIARKHKADSLVGKWQANEAYRPVVFTIERGASGFRVQAIDQSDGEKLLVSRVKWDGKVLSFETLTPSNKWRTKNRLKVISKTKAIHELTFWENLEKIDRGVKP